MTSASKSQLKRQFYNYIVERYERGYEVFQRPHHKDEEFSDVVFNKLQQRFEKHNNCNVNGLFSADSPHHPDNFKRWIAEQYATLRQDIDVEVRYHINKLYPSVGSCTKYVQNNLPLPSPISLEEFARKVFNVDANGPDDKYTDKRPVDMILGTQRIRNWYAEYRATFKRLIDEIKQWFADPSNYNHDIRTKKWLIEVAPREVRSDYPFSTKYERFCRKANRKDLDVRPTRRVPDPRLMKKYLMRPYYAPTIGAWEMDHAKMQLADGAASLLFVININTRYLVVYRCPETATEVLKCLKQLVQTFPNGVRSIRGDGAACYSTPTRRKSSDPPIGVRDKVHGNTVKLLRWYDAHGIKFYFDGSDYTNKNRIVDRVMRTVRDAIGDVPPTWEQLQDVVWYYNNTPHNSLHFVKRHDSCAGSLQVFDDVVGSSFACAGLSASLTRQSRDITPYEMQCDPELEWQYIRYCDMKALKARSRQQFHGLTNYEPGNILMVHIDVGKTSMKFNKRRRTFNRLGMFVEYTNGNVVTRLLNVNDKHVTFADTVIVPVYCTRKVAESLESIPDNVLQTYNA